MSTWISVVGPKDADAGEKASSRHSAGGHRLSRPRRSAKDPAGDGPEGHRAAGGTDGQRGEQLLVSLVRTGLAAADEKLGHYRLGPAPCSSASTRCSRSTALKSSVASLRDTTRRSVAVAAWTDDGPISPFKQDGDQRGAFEFRTGLIPMPAAAAGKIDAARLPTNPTAHLIEAGNSLILRDCMVGAVGLEPTTR